MEKEIRWIKPLHNTDSPTYSEPTAQLSSTSSISSLLLAGARGLCNPHPLQMYRPAVAAKAGTDTPTGTMETAHSTKHRLQLPPQTVAAGGRHGWTHKWIHEWRNESQTGQLGTEEENSKTKGKKQDAEQTMQPTNACGCLGKCDPTHQCQKGQVCW